MDAIIAGGSNQRKLMRRITHSLMGKKSVHPKADVMKKQKKSVFLYAFEQKAIVVSIMR